MSYRDERYLPFEGCGVDVMWELEMPKASNQFDFKSIVDMILTIDYTALSNSEYKKKVIAALGADAGGMLPFSMKTMFPDTWYHFNNPVWLKPLENGNDSYVEGNIPRRYSLKFAINRTMFPPNEEDHSIERVAFRFGFENPDIRIPIKIQYTTETGRTYEQNNLRIGGDGYLALESGKKGMIPFGIWEIQIYRDTAPELLWTKNKDGSPVMEKITDPNRNRHVLDTKKINDIILAITYKAKLEWPYNVSNFIHG